MRQFLPVLRDSLGVRIRFGREDRRPFQGADGARRLRVKCPSIPDGWRALAITLRDLGGPEAGRFLRLCIELNQ